MTTWSSAYRDGNGQTVEVTSDLPRFEVAAAGGAWPLYFRDDRPTRT